MEKLHSFMEKLVIHPISNKFIGDFQRLCGVKKGEDPKRTVLYWFFRFFSMTEEELYSLMPLVFWLSPPLAAGYILNFGIICDIAQISKDIFQLPRPPAGGCGGIIRLENQHATEYGFPSTHITGAFLPLSVLMNLSRLGVAIPSSYYYIAFSHIFLLGMSRLYLGVHSPMDLIGGLFLATPLLYAIHWNELILEELLVFSPYSLYLNLFLLFLFLFCYPLGKNWTASYGTSAQFFGSYFGVVTAIWYVTHHSNWCWNSFQYTSLYYQHAITSHSLTLILIGLLVAGIGKVLGKGIPMYLLIFLYKRGIIREQGGGGKKGKSKYLKDAEGKDVPIEKLYCVEIPSRLISYTLVAWGVFVFAPLTWRYFDLIPQDEIPPMTL